MIIKKQIFLIIIAILCVGEKLYSQSPIQTLAEFALKNNIDIKKAESTYESAKISAKNLNGYYSPGVSINSSTIIDKGYKWNKNPETFSSSVVVTQPLPGGFTLSTTGTYAFETWEDTVRKMQQSPGVSFTLLNSLYPYWAQGVLYNPEIMSLKQQKEYSYNKLLSTKKEVFENLIQNYAMAVNYKKSIQIYENSICLIQEQINAVKELRKVGNTNQTKITELENTKWSYQQDLISAIASYKEYIQSLKNLCGTNFDEQILNNEIESATEVIKLINNYIGDEKDPYEKNLMLQISMLETERIQQKSKNSPNITLTITPSWSIDVIDEKEWNKAWMNEDSFSSWYVSVGIDFTDMINGFSSNVSKQAEIEYEIAKETYDSYLEQREFVEKEYISLFSSYCEQSGIISSVLDSGELEFNELKGQLEVGTVSFLDYYSKEINVKNMRLSKESIEIICWMYEILIELLY